MSSKKEIRSILNAFEEWNERGIRSALVSVVFVDGSAYRRIGARMLVAETGEWIGGISGGCLEGDALLRAQQAIYKNEPSIVTYDTSEDDEHQIGVGLGCNGIIDVLFTPVSQSNQYPILKQLKLILDSRDEHILITVSRGSSDQEDWPLGISFFANHIPVELRDKAKELPGHIEWVNANKQSLNVWYEDLGIQLTLEHIPPELHLVVVGDHFDVYALLEMTKNLDWRTTCMASPKRMTKELKALAHHLIAKDAHDQVLIDQNTFIVLMSHDYKTDKRHLLTFLESQAPYIGLLGPKVRSEKILDELSQEADLSGLDPNRIDYPIGLDIGADSPEEISLSILSGIQAKLKQKEGGFLSHLAGPIHARIPVVKS